MIKNLDIIIKINIQKRRICVKIEIGVSMKLDRENWTKQDGQEFQEYLLSLSRGEEKVIWQQNITRTNLPCLAIPSKDIDKITKQLSKGNFISFLNLNLWDNLENTIINVGLLGYIKDFKSYIYYLNKFVNKADNWATIDTINFKIKGKETEFLNLAKDYIGSKKPFVRRAGVRILFKYINDEYIQEVFRIISNLTDEKEYYVNMALAWLVCESFIKQRNMTSTFLKQQKLNKFVQNKAISKCHDSFRVSSEDKRMLFELRI